MLEALLDARWDTSIASRELESEAELHKARQILGLPLFTDRYAPSRLRELPIVGEPPRLVPVDNRKDPWLPFSINRRHDDVASVQVSVSKRDGEIVWEEVAIRVRCFS